MVKKVTNIKEVSDLAREILDSLNVSNTATILGLYGNLGAGKTTFTQQVSKVLGVSDNVLSPTFVIMKIYDLVGQKWKHLVHIDAYRMENSKELINLGFEEIISDSSNLVLIEWPEKVSDIMPEHKAIRFKVVDENTREIEYD